jgi:hypothetical protein
MATLLPTWGQISKSFRRKSEGVVGEAAVNPRPKARAANAERRNMMRSLDDGTRGPSWVSGERVRAGKRVGRGSIYKLCCRTRVLFLSTC